MLILLPGPGIVGAATTAYRLNGQTLTGRALAAIALGAVVAAMLIGRIWRVGRLAITAVHEGGHAVVAALCGRTVTSVHLRADTSGVTFHKGSLRRGVGSSPRQPGIRHRDCWPSAVPPCSPTGRHVRGWPSLPASAPS